MARVEGLIQMLAHLCPRHCIAFEFGEFWKTMLRHTQQEQMLQRVAAETCSFAQTLCFAQPLPCHSNLSMHKLHWGIQFCML